MNVYERMQEAQKTGELVPIIYHGGSHPGLARLIYPVKVSETDVWGREADGTRAKQYKLHKIEIARGDAVIHNFAAEPETPEAEDLAQVLAPYLAEVEAAPWHVERDQGSIALYAFFKNGKRRKLPLLTLRSVEPYPYRTEIDWETGEERQVERQLTGAERPWSVESRRGSRNFKKLSSAVIRFMEEFHQLCPQA